MTVRSTSLLGACLFALAASTAEAADWFVNGKTGADRNPGTSRRPFATIQRAIAAAAPSGDRIVVAAFRYRENLQVAGKSLAIAGAGRDTTVVDGQYLRPVLRVDGPATVNLAGLTLTAGAADPVAGGAGGAQAVNATLNLDGCAVTGNRDGGVFFDHGGGDVRNSLVSQNEGFGVEYFFCSVPSVVRGCDVSHNLGTGIVTVWSSPRIVRNTISFNQGGGAAFHTLSGPSLVQNHIHGNTAQNGAGILDASNSGSSSYGNLIEGNTAAGYGGGVAALPASLSYDGDIIRGNAAGVAGGGMYFSGTVWSALTHVIVAGNSAPEGAGIALGSANVALYNLTVTANAGTVAGAGIFTAADPAKSSFLESCIVSGNLVAGAPADLAGYTPAQVTHSLVGDPAFCGPGTEGNLCADPGFVPGDPLFHLLPTSAARDAGHNTGLWYTGRDFEFDPRQDGFVDIGADEYSPAPPPPLFNVESIQLAAVKTGKAYREVATTVFAADATGAPVAGVTVRGYLYGPAGEPALQQAYPMTAVTGADGKAVLGYVTTNSSLSRGVYQYCTETLAKEGSVYLSGADAELCDTLTF